MVCGFPRHECGDRTTISDSTGSTWALEYATTPSSPRAASNFPSGDQYFASTEMIECALIDGATGTAWRPWMKGLRGDTLSTAVGAMPLLTAPGFRARSADTAASWKGRIVSRRTSLAIVR